MRPENIAVNGPFILGKEWIPNDHIRLAKNPRFYDAANVALDEVFFYPTEDSAAALKRFRAGELDLCNRCPAQPQVPEVRREMPGAMRISPFIATYFMLTNHGRPPFNDARVREAISLAIDRETLMEKVVKIGSLPAYNLVPPGMPGYPYSAQLRFKGMPLGQRQEKARSLLAAAGFGPRQTSRLRSDHV